MVAVTVALVVVATGVFLAGANAVTNGVPEALPTSTSTPPVTSAPSATVVLRCVEPSASPSVTSPSATPSATVSPSASSLTAVPTPSATMSPTMAPSESSSSAAPTITPEPTSSSASASSASPTASESAVSASPRAAERVASVCPQAPTGVGAKAGRSKVDLSWQAPGLDGPVVTGYRISVEPGGRIVDIAAARPAATIGDLDNGIDYTFTVAAVNDYGASAAATVMATPSLGEPAEVERLIVAYEPGVPVTEAPGRATGSAAVDDVALIPDTALGAGMRTVELSEGVSEGTAERMAAELTADPRVKWAEPDNFVPLLSATVPNDTYYAAGSMWGLNGTYGIQAPQAWAVTRGSSSIVVAVLDTGITVHPDLAGQTVAGYDMIVDPAVSVDGNGRDADPSDPGDAYAGSTSSWHGTHVTGTINAIADNATGVVGVAPLVKVQPVRVLGSGGGYMSDIVAGITWASGGSVPGVPANATPARVISMSLGGGAPCSTAENTAISAANARNTVVVVAAGNSNQNAAGFTPAGCSGVIAVAATGSNGKRASFSNYGSTVDIAAPGVSIVSTLNSGATTTGSPSYAYYSGTSMATPHVSGVVALMLSQNPALTPAQVEARIKSPGMSTPFPGGACDADPVKTCGPGIINAAALLSATPAPTPVSGVSVSPTSLSVAVGATGQLSATVTPSNATNRSVTWTSSNPAIATVGVTGIVTGVSAGTATITVTTADGGFMARAAITVTGPVAVTGVSVAPTTLSLVRGAVGTLTATVTPAQATNPAVTWSSSNPTIASVSNSGVVTGVGAGTATIRATTVDGGFVASSTITVTVAVTGVTVAPSSVSLTTGGTTALTATVLPADASNRSLSWSSSNAAVASVSTSGVVTALAPGAATITVRTIDGGFSASAAVNVSGTIAVSGVSVTPTSLGLERGATGVLSAVISPANATNQTVLWSSSDSRIATVTWTGVVTARRPGSVTITARTEDGGKSASATVTVNRLQQSIAFTTPTTLPVNQSPFLLRASASSGLPVTFTASGACSVSGTVLVLTRSGTCTVAADQAGSDMYLPAPSVVNTIAISKRSQAITLSMPSALQVGTSVRVNVSSSSRLPVTLTSSTPSTCVVTSATTVAAQSGGTCTLTASQAGDDTFAAAADVVGSMTVLRRAQTISVSAPSRVAMGAPSLPLAAASTSGLPVTWLSTTPPICTVSAGAATFASRGACQLTLTQAGDGSWEAATRSWTITVVGQSQSIAFTSLSNVVMGTDPVTLSATASSGLNVAFAASPTSVCSTDGKTLVFVSVGRCTVTASQSGSETFEAATPVARALTVGQGSTRVSVSPSMTAAYTRTAITFTASVVDGMGRPQANRRVAFYSRVWSPWNTGYTLLGTAQTDSAGTARMSLPFAAANRYEVLAESALSVEYQSARGSAQVDISRISTSTTVDSVTGPATVGVPIPLQATVTPAAGPVQAGMTVTFSTRIGAGAWTFQGRAQTDNSGQARLPVTVSTAGGVQVRAEVTGTADYASSIGITAPFQVSRRP